MLKEYFYDWGGYNTGIFYAINGVHDRIYDQFMMLGTMSAKYYLFFLYFPLISFVAYYKITLRKTSPQASYEEYVAHWIKTLTVMVMAFLFMLLWVSVLKDYLHFPRPFVALPEGTVIKLWDETPYSSFPSGHCGFSMVMAAGLWPILGKRGKKIAVFYVVWVGVSRIVLGVHFPADVLGSYLLSFISIQCVKAAVDWIWAKKKTNYI